MEKNIKIYFRSIIASLLLQSTIGSAEITGLFSIDTGLDTGHVSESVGRYYADSLDYVNGGITFTYPASFFATTPLVLISVQLTGRSYNPIQLVVGEIVSNSATSTTVRVNLHNGLLISEVATGDVTVYLKAIAPEPE